MLRASFQSLTVLLAAITVLSACQNEGAPAAVATAPLALTPAAEGSGVGGKNPTAEGALENGGSGPIQSQEGLPQESTAKPSNDSVVLFRDDFSGTTVDTTKWKVFEKTGVVRQRDGWLEVRQIPGEADFPFILNTAPIIPETGPWYCTVRAQWFNAKNESVASFLNWDVLPPSGPDDAGYAPPTIQVRNSYYKPVITFRGGGDVREKAYPDNSQAPFECRIECDENNNYQLLVNDTILLSGKSTRRPRHFWIGTYPNAPRAGVRWHDWKFDFIEVGVLKALTLPPSPDEEVNQGNG